ncbi:hypothetical protein Tco_0094802, partial [Tanacetum coccineum]
YRTDYELKEPGFELEDSKMGRNGSNSTRTPRIRASGLQGLDSFLHFCSWDSIDELGRNGEGVS